MDAAPDTRLAQWLRRAARQQGHRCVEQMLGVRMAILGCRMLEMTEPGDADCTKLYVFVEVDCCATDAIAAVTGCTLGRRTLHHVDFGILAATFVDLETGRAVRVAVGGEAGALANPVCPGVAAPLGRPWKVCKEMPESVLFHVEPVTVIVPPEDLPGSGRVRVPCAQCGDWIQDGREVRREGLLLCRGCAWGRYYHKLRHGESDYRV